MDRLDAMRAFVTAIDEGSLAAAARRLNRSPAAITRALSLLEDLLGARLAQRSTRSLALTAAGENYLAVCRRVLAELDDAALLAAGERSTPRGLLTVTAPLHFGRLHVRPVIDAFLAAQPAVQARLLLLDRVANLIDEGIDVAVRIGHLPDSNHFALSVGVVRKVLCASPAYLAAHPPLRRPADLAEHATIVFTQLASGDRWVFESPAGEAQSVRVRPRLSVNGAEAAIESAREGRGVTAVLCYQIDADLRSGALVIVLDDYEAAPLPVHLVYPEARLVSAKVRGFLDLAVPKLRAQLAQLYTVDHPPPKRLR